MKRFELVTKKVFRGDLEEEFVIPGKQNFPSSSQDIFPTQTSNAIEYILSNTPVVLMPSSVSAC